MFWPRPLTGAAFGSLPDFSTNGKIVEPIERGVMPKITRLETFVIGDGPEIDPGKGASNRSRAYGFILTADQRKKPGMKTKPGFSQFFAT